MGALHAMPATPCACELTARVPLQESAEQNMAALGATVTQLTRVMDGAVVYLDEPQLTRQQLASSLLGQQRRLVQLQQELDAAQRAHREATQLIASLRGEVADTKVALAAHVDELLATRELLERERQQRGQQHP